MEYRFSIGPRQFLFDGESLNIFELDGNEEVENNGSGQERPAAERPGYLRSLVLNITNRCNLCCDYCFANQGGYDLPGIDMSFETAKRAAGVLVESALRNGAGRFTLGFFGGEPLLNFDLIRRVAEYVEGVKSGNQKVDYLITTNGTLIDQAHADFFREHRFAVTLSLDGAEKAHDCHRVHFDGRGSYSLAIRAAELLLASNVPLTARITLTDENSDIAEAVKNVKELGIRRITFARNYAMSNEGVMRLTSSLRRLSSLYLGWIRAGELIDITNVTEPIVSVALKRRKRAHCNAGISYLSVSADGSYYRCPRFTGHNTHRVGDIRSGPEVIDESAKQFIERLGANAGSRSESCAACPFSALCGGICYHHALSRNGSADEFSPVKEECFFRKALFHEALKITCSLSVSERRDLLSGLKKLWQPERR